MSWHFARRLQTLCLSTKFPGPFLSRGKVRPLPLLDTGMSRADWDIIPAQGELRVYPEFTEGNHMNES